MKMHFNFNIAGVKKSDSNGVTKVWEGAQCQFEMEAEIGEVVQILKDRQISADKLISFIKQDLPQSIKDCGSALLDIEKQNRILNAEMPSKSRKAMMEEIEHLKRENNDLYNEKEQIHDKMMDEHLNKISEREQCDNLKKELEEKTNQFNSMRADFEGTMKSFRDLENKYGQLQRDYEILKAQWNSENEDRDNTLADALAEANHGIRKYSEPGKIF